MLATESVHKQFGGLDRSFLDVSGRVQRDISDVTRSGNYYVTPEVAREISHINTGINQIRLDHDFLRSSREWGNKWSPDQTNRDKQGAIRAVENAAQTMSNIKSGMRSDTIKTLQENQVTANNQASVAQLRNVERDMGPYVHKAVDRINQFCDNMGVTDRYTGYRNNLTRGRQDPTHLGNSWLDLKHRNSLNASLNVGWKPGSTVPGRPSYDWRNQIPAYSAPPSVRCSQEPATRKSIQEQCGINTKFPGSTEYMDRFSHPPTNQPTQGYIVNPRPDFRVNGRELGYPKFERCATEYQTRYESPDGSKLVKLPWLRK